MADILLLEPVYKSGRNYYPPLGLMKISYFHKHIKGDYVRFSKGELPENLKNKKWDRVYVTTLFTFEWHETIKMIEYAKLVCKDPGNIFIGGIAATLMPKELEKETGIKPITGLLNVKGKIGYEDDDLIDTLTPDYDMLNDTSHQYVYQNAYFTYTTRGCGQKCGFCAVQKLEPEYIPYVSIKKQISDIKEKYGEKKDLLLMDNNVLKSPCFEKIVNDLIELGFGKGAVYKSPASGKLVPRYIDFNQGLDAFLFDDEKAFLLSKLAIKPARIAFDHIEDVNTYEKAIRLCAKYDIEELSNYILFNSKAFNGKGQSYIADKPDHLYERIDFTLKLQTEINKERKKDKKISIFSFPMRYIPLNAKERGYVGPEWNMKNLRAIQRILIPTQGKGVSSRSFFDADFGVDVDEFKKILLMPEDIIAMRGRFDETKSGLKDETEEQKKIRRLKWEENHSVWNEWERLYNELGEHKAEFIDLIKDNKFSSEMLFNIEDKGLQKIYLHYFSQSQFLSLLNDVQSDQEVQLLYEYCVVEFPLFLKRIVDYIFEFRVPYSKLAGFIKIFGKEGLRLGLGLWIKGRYENDIFLDSLEKAMELARCSLINITMVKTFKYYYSFGCLSESDIRDIEKYILDFNNYALILALKRKFTGFKKALASSIDGSVGEKALSKYIDSITAEIYKQITLFDIKEKTMGE